MKHRFLSKIAVIFAIGMFVIGSATAADGAAQSTGTIEGRVYLPSADRYLENAIVTIAGINRQVTTDGIGFFRFTNVPAGTVQITASFTGFPAQTASVPVKAGEIAQLDINISLVARPGLSGDEIVKLDRFIVNADRVQTGAALARNEQRYASDMRTVISVDEFGENPTGNLGEFMKHLPGVTISEVNGEARNISIDGVGSEHVPVTFGGLSMANAASGLQSREFQLDGVSVSNMSRIEVSFSPTPEVEGRALAGSVNIVPPSAFEYSRPRFEINTYITLDGDSMTLNKTPGPWFTPTRKSGPSIRLNYRVPVSKRFGFTIAADRSIFTVAKEQQRTYWRGSSVEVGVLHFPVTDVNNPYMSRIDLYQGSSLNENAGFSLTADWRFSRNDRLSFAINYNYKDLKYNNRTLIVAIQNFNPENVSILTPYYSEGNGYARQQQEARRKTMTTYMPTITWRHMGPLWKMNAAFGYSHASSHYGDIPNGFFYSAQADRGNAKIIFDQMHYDGPRRIQVTDLGGTNAAINPYALDDLSLNTIMSRSNDAYDRVMNGFFDIRRDFRLWSVPIFLKAGYDYKQTKRARDNVRNYDWQYLGADGRGSGAGNDPTTAVMLPFVSADDGAKRFSDKSFSTVPIGFGHPNIEWVDLAALYQMYQINPGYFLVQNTDTNIRDVYDVTETINSAYIRSDIYLFKNRVQIAGGVRVEQTDIEGHGALRTNVGGRMQWIRNGAQSDVSYSNWLPRVNMNWEITPGRTLIARAAYFESMGRPGYGQYAGELTMPDRDATGSNTGNRFGLKNSEIEPWTSRTFSAGLDYYFTRNGSMSVRVFDRKINNFFIDTISPVSDALLSHYGLDPLEYDGYYVATQTNSDQPATVQGLTLSYEQSLTFLPKWAQGFRVSANATFQDLSGPGEDNLIDPDGNFRPRLYKANISYSNRRFSLRAGWVYFGETRTAKNTSVNVPEGTYTYFLARDYVEASGELRMGKFTAYFKVSNITGDPERICEIRGPNTPEIARLRYITQYSPQWTFGIKAVF